MQQLGKKILVGMMIILLLPIGVTAGISGTAVCKGKVEVNLENYLPIILCQQIDWDYEEEALKAQAVLARSSLYLCVKNGEISNNMWKNLMKEYRNSKNLASYQSAYEKMEKAVNDTKGEILMYNGRICAGVFHKVSAGYTRDGKEVLKDVTYGYLSSILSEADICASNYLQGYYFSEQALKMRILEVYPDVVWTEASVFEQIQIIERDSKEYVTKIKIGNVTVAGEEFRKHLELASSNFSLQQMDGKIRFLCKGNGHGLGMSQFGANEMAKNGNTYIEILKYYFPEAAVNNV